MTAPLDHAAIETWRAKLETEIARAHERLHELPEDAPGHYAPNIRCATLVSAEMAFARLLDKHFEGKRYRLDSIAHKQRVKDLSSRVRALPDVQATLVKLYELVSGETR